MMVPAGLILPEASTSAKWALPRPAKVLDAAQKFILQIWEVRSEHEEKRCDVAQQSWHNSSAIDLEQLAVLSFQPELLAEDQAVPKGPSGGCGGRKRPFDHETPFFASPQEQSKLARVEAILDTTSPVFVHLPGQAVKTHWEHSSAKLTKAFHAANLSASFALSQLSPGYCRPWIH